MVITGKRVGAPRLAPQSARRVGVAVAVTLALSASMSALAQSQPSRAQIYSCVDANGKRLTSDRPIPECNSRDQRVLNSDGSVKEVRRPALTADERAEAEAREQQALVEQKRRQEDIRRDRNLQARFPDEAAHRKAREAALEDVRKSLRASEARLLALASERKPLMDEAEFYAKGKLPLKLKQALDANDATVAAQKALVQNQQLEILRIDQLFDAELERLRGLWRGRQPGSMGSLAASPPASSPRH